MENSTEKSPERIPTKSEVLDVVLRFVENFELVRELSDEHGLYLLEVKVQGETAAECIQYEYMRKGRFADHGEASETALHKVSYVSGEAQGGEKIAVYNPETDLWQETS